MANWDSMDHVIAQTRGKAFQTLCQFFQTFSRTLAFLFSLSLFSFGFRWKMSFNPDINKQAQEAIFSHKLQKSNHPSLTFNDTIVTKSKIQNHLGIFLDSKLDLKEQIQNVLNKVSKTRVATQISKNILPRPPLITIYKSFIRLHLDYRDTIYDQKYNASFHQKLGVHSVQRRTSNNRSYKRNI